MKSFEMSAKQYKNGRRKFKAILYEIYPDSCVDEETQEGTRYNLNGITWLREPCEKALPSIEGMSLRCVFTDEDRTELEGHGETDFKDGLPVFEDAVVLGTFSKGYIADVDLDGEKKTVCIGEGTIDGLCYANFVEKLDKELAAGYAPKGSVEILKTGGNDSIIYKYGYKEKGRIPLEFEHSGYALLGVKPADNSAQLIELNNKEDNAVMTSEEIKAVVTETMASINDINATKEECAKNVEEANAGKSAAEAELAKCKSDLDEKCAECEKLSEELAALKKELAACKKQEKCNAFNEAIKEFTDDEKAYAEAEINAFNENPIDNEINVVVNKIWEGIGRKSREIAKAAESNEAHIETEDIFSSVEETAEVEDDDIF